MFRNRLNSNNSSSSSNTNASNNNNENSNVLYNDREHYEVIFKNDSRFFDTSLHLFKSYRKRGYLPPMTKKRGKSPFLSVPPVLRAAARTPSNGSLGKSKLPGFNSNHNVSLLPSDHGKNNNTITSTQFRRNQDHSMSLRSDPGIPKLGNRSNQNATMSSHYSYSRPVQSSLPTPPFHYRTNQNNNDDDDDDDDSDGQDIIVTRL